MTPINNNIIAIPEAQESESFSGLVLTLIASQLATAIVTASATNDVAIGDRIWYIDSNALEATIGGEKCVVLRAKDVIGYETPGKE